MSKKTYIISILTLLILSSAVFADSRKSRSIVEESSKNANWKISKDAKEFIENKYTLVQSKNDREAAYLLASYLDLKSKYISSSEIEIDNLYDFSIDLLKKPAQLLGLEIDVSSVFKLKKISIGNREYEYNNSIEIESGKTILIPYLAKEDVILHGINLNNSNNSTKFRIILTINHNQKTRGPTIFEKIFMKIFGPPAQRATISFQTSPEGAIINVNGQDEKGIENSKIFVEPGLKTIRIIKTGFEELEIAPHSLGSGDYWMIITTLNAQDQTSK